MILYIKLLAKITLPSSFKCEPSSNKFSEQMLLLSIHPNPFNLKARSSMLFTAIALSVNIFCALHINDEIKTSFTLLSLHCRPIFTIHSAISVSVSYLLLISLQPICSIKTSGVSSFKIGFTYVSICFRVAPISGLNRVLHLFNFELNSFLEIPLIILVPRMYVFRPNFTALLKSVLSGTIAVVALFIWRCTRSLSRYLFTTGDGLRVFCVAKLFICRSMV